MEQNRRITIVLDNHHFVLADLTSLLGGANINIEAMDADSVEDYGIIHLSVDRYDEALRILREADYHAFPDDAMVIRVEDKPGALAKVAVLFKEAAIDIRSLRLIKREDGYCFVSIVSERSKDARELVKHCLVA